MKVGEFGLISYFRFTVHVILLHSIFRVEIMFLINVPVIPSLKTRVNLLINSMITHNSSAHLFPLIWNTPLKYRDVGVSYLSYEFIFYGNVVAMNLSFMTILELWIYLLWQLYYSYEYFFHCHVKSDNISFINRFELWIYLSW